MSELEEAFYQQLRLAGLPLPEREVRPVAGRRWRLDFAWPARRLALELEGGQYVHGRHQRPGGFERDCEKYNMVALAGWLVLRVTTAMIADGRALALVRRALETQEDER